jgi:hypothetical protein
MGRELKILLLTAGVLLAGLPAHAETSRYFEWYENQQIIRNTNSYEPVQQEQDQTPKPRFTLGPVLYHHNYEEPGLMEQDGMFYGLAGGITWTRDLTLMIDGTVAFGQVDYTSNGTGAMDDVDDLHGEVRVSIGKDFILNDSLSIMPYAGFGYWYLKDDSVGRQTDTGHYGYLRKANYYYSPLGARVTLQPHKKFWLTLTAEYDHFWYGNQETDLSSLGEQRLDNRQKSGYGLRGSVGIHRLFGSTLFSIEPFVRYWDIDKSEEEVMGVSGPWVVVGYEPANETMETGVRMNVSW